MGMEIHLCKYLNKVGFTKGSLHGISYVYLIYGLREGSYPTGEKPGQSDIVWYYMRNLLNI